MAAAAAAKITSRHAAASSNLRPKILNSIDRKHRQNTESFSPPFIRNLARKLTNEIGEKIIKISAVCVAFYVKTIY